MTKHVFIVDGMLSGTGIRDGVNGGYLELHEIGISDVLQRRIDTWLSRYEDAHYHQYKNKNETALLDQQGIELAKMIKTELPTAAVKYFSNADMKEIGVE